MAAEKVGVFFLTPVFAICFPALTKLHQRKPNLFVQYIAIAQKMHKYYTLIPLNLFSSLSQVSVVDYDRNFVITSKNVFFYR